MKLFNLIPLLFILPGALIFSPMAKATCSFASGYGKSTTTIQLPTQLTLQRDTVPGTVLWDSGWVSGTRNNISCNTSSSIIYGYKIPLTPLVNMSDVYQTNNDAIGVRGYFRNDPDIPGNLLTYPQYSKTFTSGRYVPDTIYEIQLIATGLPASSSTLTLPTPLAELYYSPLLVNELILSNATVVIAAAACSLNSTTISVPLGDISQTRFSGVGSTAGEQTFNLGLMCDANAKINATLSGTQNPDTSDTSILALTNAGQPGTAVGVGVQLLYNSAPLQINQFLPLKISAGGQEMLPFTARYYQTGSVISPGVANSTATLNIVYQ